MPVSGKMYVWGDRAKHIPAKPGVYAFYNEAKALIYIGGSTSLQERFSQYLETNFMNDHRKRDTKYYKREFTPNHEDRIKMLLDEYRQKHGKFPKCNSTPEPPRKEVASEWGFYFYEDIGKPLFEAAFNPKELKEKIRKVPLVSIEFHQKRGDFARWFRDVFKDVQHAQIIDKIDGTGEDLRNELLKSLNGNEEEATCPECESRTNPVKTWKMAGRPSKTGERLQLTIGYYKCPKCSKTFRNVIAKEKIKAF
ncbi:GIY-YIG nuclease family protein [Candidatus Bathyarchaeota archaeon]|nr:GIY-YIG nuclease family protein [Candidatus Bathyarchaeota archaeon]NIV44206.1 GIY-YIG nuclease family protein [Candidatus Bathyarchaeota archaeon]